jgi:two-component sensor histidine kinase
MGPQPEDLSGTLLAEAHHRAANSFQIACSTIARASVGVGDPQARLTLARVDAQLRAFAVLNEQLHRRACLPDSLSICAATYLDELCAQLGSACLEQIGVGIEVQASGGWRVDEVRCRHLGLITTELVLNAAKHAFAGRIGGLVRVTLEQPSPAPLMRLTVADDGQGCDEIVIAAGHGLSLVGVLVNAMGGALLVKTGQSGTTFEITLPA